MLEERNISSEGGSDRNNDGIIHVMLKRAKRTDPWGIRIAGGKDEGLVFKLAKVQIGSPAYSAGLQPRDLLVSVGGKVVFDMKHDEVAQLVRDAELELEIVVERGDSLIPTLNKAKQNGQEEEKSNFYIQALQEEPDLPRTARDCDKVFTTVGPQKIYSDQYNKPLGLYCADTVAQMADTVDIDPTLTGDRNKVEKHFQPDQSNVLDLILEDDEFSASGGDFTDGLEQLGTASRNSSRATSIGPLQGTERRGSRRLSLLSMDESKILRDKRLSISEGRYGDLGYKTIV